MEIFMRMKHLIFVFCCLVVLLQVEEVHGQMVEKVQDQGDILKDYKNLVLNKVVEFEKKTNVKLFVLISYQVNPQEAVKYANKWAGKGNDGILITINPQKLWDTEYESGDWWQNIRIDVSSTLTTKLSTSSRNVIVRENMAPLLNGATIFSSDQFYQAIEKGINELDYIVDPPPLKLVGVEYLGRSIKEGEVLVLCKQTEEVVINPLEKYGRNFPEGKLGANSNIQVTWDPTLSINGSDGNYKFTFDASKASATAEGTPVTISYEQQELHFTILIVDIKLAKSSFVVNQGRQTPTADIQYSILPAGLELDLMSSGDYTTTVKGNGVYNWKPVDPTGAYYQPGDITIMFKHKIGEDDNEKWLNGVSAKITILAEGDLTNLVVTQMDTIGKPTSRFVASGGTLYMIKKGLWTKKYTMYSAKSSINKFFVGEPLWYKNDVMIFQTNPNKTLSGFKGNSADNNFYYISSDAGVDKIIVKAYDDSKEVTISIENYKERKSNDFAPQFSTVLKNLTRINDKIFKHIPTIDKDRFSVKVSTKYESKKYMEEEERSPLLVENEAREGKIEISVSGKIPIPGLYAGFSIGGFKAGVEAYVEPGFAASFLYNSETFNQFKPKKIKSAVGGQVEGYISAGGRLYLDSPEGMPVGLTATGEAYFKLAANFQLLYQIEDEKLGIKGDLGNGSLNAVFSVTGKAFDSEWEIYNYNWSYLLWEGYPIDETF